MLRVCRRLCSLSASAGRCYHSAAPLLHRSANISRVATIPFPGNISLLATGDPPISPRSLYMRAYSDGRRRRPPSKASSRSSNDAEGGDDDAGELPSAQAPLESTGIVKATVPAVYPEILSIPITGRPIFPGFYKTVTVKDPHVAEALAKALKRGQPYVGLFLSRTAKEQDAAEGEVPASEADVDPARSPREDGQVIVDSSETGAPPAAPSNDTIKDLCEIHNVGVFAQIINVIPLPNKGLTAIVFPHRRIRATKVLQAPNTAAKSSVTEGADPTESHAQASATILRTENAADEQYNRKDDVIRATSQEIFSMLSDVAKLNPFFREHITHHNVSASVFEDPAKLADFVAVLCSSDGIELQEILEEARIEERLQKALVLLKKELVSAKLQDTISKEIERKISTRQREFLLHEQLRAIKKELGLSSDPKTKVIEAFKERADSLVLPPPVKAIFDQELEKFSMLESSSSEYNVCRNYLEWLTQIPWGRHSKEDASIAKAEEILNADHFGMKDVKERILEFMAVQKLQRASTPGKIICLAGPPGVGKTSIGKSIARALGREYYRFSVGGLADASEIKGHRRTYLGSMPGKIIQALKRVQTMDPLILIDEVDKMGKGSQGDPAAALLEVLDPEQNSSFMDYYLDVPVDLSKVLFVCTANVKNTIPPALIDRMEVIDLTGYVSEEKMEIAKRYLMPISQRECGFGPDEGIQMTDDALEMLIGQYCRESGVRNLKNHIDKIYRKAALRIARAIPGAEDAILGEKDATSSSKDVIDPSSDSTSSNGASCKTHAIEKEAVVSVEKDANDSKASGSMHDRPTPRKPIIVNGENLSSFVGGPKFTSDRIYTSSSGGNVLPVGVSTALAYTSMGGSILYIETILDRHISRQAKRNGTNASPSAEESEAPNAKGHYPNLIVTGNLGDTIKESSKIAYSYAKAFVAKHFPDSTFFDHASIHLHLPEGATPKDGPSAGCAMATALISQALDRPISSEIAMTGELTLVGRVLQIGGVKEKAMAAKREGISTLIFPEACRNDWEELESYVRSGLTVHFVKSYDEIASLLSLI